MAPGRPRWPPVSLPPQPTCRSSTLMTSRRDGGQRPRWSMPTRRLRLRLSSTAFDRSGQLIHRRNGVQPPERTRLDPRCRGGWVPRTPACGPGAGGPIGVTSERAGSAGWTRCARGDVPGAMHPVVAADRPGPVSGRAHARLRQQPGSDAAATHRHLRLRPARRVCGVAGLDSCRSSVLTRLPRSPTIAGAGHGSAADAKQHEPGAQVDTPGSPGQRLTARAR